MSRPAFRGFPLAARRCDANTKNKILSNGDGEDLNIIPTWDDVLETYLVMELDQSLLRGLHAYGFVKPLSSQQLGTIVPFMKGFDVIHQAESGIERTVTLCTGILQRLDYQNLKCQGLVLASTGKLAQQIKHVMSTLGKYLNVKVYACNNGESISAWEDEKILQTGVHIVVGTPDLVLDMLRRHALQVDSLKCFVLDEITDEMLSGGFKDEIYDTFKLLPQKLIQVGLFSTTMPQEALELMNTNCHRFLTSQQLHTALKTN